MWAAHADFTTEKFESAFHPYSFPVLSVCDIASGAASRGTASRTQRRTGQTGQWEPKQDPEKLPDPDPDRDIQHSYHNVDHMIA